MSAARAAALAALLLAAAPAHASCPEWLVADMAERGVPDREVARMCGPPPTRSLVPAAPSAQMAPAARPAPEVRQSNRCVPDTGGSCPTQTLRVVGSPCWCILPGGTYAEGTIR
jgi:hypothetical protein